MEYKEVQKIAKDTIEYARRTIRSGMWLIEVRKLCENKLLELGADSFWYWDIGAFVFAGDETTVWVSGTEYKTSLGHSIVKQKSDRIYIEKGNRTRLSDVSFFTFEPHISVPGSKYGYKRENIYYFEDGKSTEL